MDAKSSVESKERDAGTTSTAMFIWGKNGLVPGCWFLPDYLVLKHFSTSWCNFWLDAGWSCANSKMGAKSLE